MDDKGKPHRAKRMTLRADIDFRRSGDHKYRVNILDFSPEGCRVEIPVNVESGDRIWISLPGLESIAGQVRWVEGWTVGVKFDRALYPSVFDLVHERMRMAE
jgi:PilZ domain